MTTVTRWSGRESRLLREALRLSVRAFAEDLGVSVRTVSKWEQYGPERVPRPDFQAMLDTLLSRADPSQRARFETASGTGGGEESTNRRQFLMTSAVVSAGAVASITATGTAAWPISPPPIWARPVHDAVLQPAAVMRQARGEAEPVSAVSAGRLAGALVTASLGSDHVTLTRHLPAAVGRVEWSLLNSSEEVRGGHLRAVSDVMATAAWTLIKANDCAAAWVAATRAVAVAEEALDPLRTAAATRCLAEVHMRAGALDQAGRIAFLSGVRLDGVASGPEVSCLRGASYLSAAAAAARRGDDREAAAALDAAGRCADTLRAERADVGTVFGPTNVAIHRVAVAVETGDGRKAVECARDVDLTRLPPALKERRARFLIDVARAYVMLGDRSMALSALLDAETRAADETRTHRHTHAIVRQLLSKSPPRGTRDLADRCGLAA